MGVPPRLQQSELKSLENLKWQQCSNQQVFTRVLQGVPRGGGVMISGSHSNTIDGVIVAVGEAVP